MSGTTVLGLGPLSLASMALPHRKEDGSNVPNEKVVNHIATYVKCIVGGLTYDNDIRPEKMGMVCPLLFMKPWNSYELTPEEIKSVDAEFALAGVILAVSNDEADMRATLTDDHCDSCKYIKRADVDRSLASWIKHRSRVFKYQISKACEESIHLGHPQPIGAMPGMVSDEILMTYLNKELSTTPLNIGGIVYIPTLTFHCKERHDSNYAQRYTLSLAFDRQQYD